MSHSTESTELSTKDSNLLSDYYLHASADPGQVICTIQLNGNNYERWSKLMRNAFKAKNKLGFIDGTVTEPKKGTDEFKLWGIVNSMMVAWILNCIEPNLRNSISCADTAFQLWDSIRQQFSLGNESRVYELNASIVTFKQDNQSVQAYYGKLKLMWDDLSEYEPFSECCCGKPTCKIVKASEEKRDREQKYQFLMGLDNTRFGLIRSNILCMQPPLSLAASFSMVLQEERNQTITRVSDVRYDAVGFSAQAAHMTGPTGRGKNVITCTHCGKTGHMIRDCYQLHGFPDWRNDNGQNRGRGGTGWNSNGNRGNWNNAGRSGSSTFGSRGRGGRGTANTIQLGSRGNINSAQIGCEGDLSSSMRSPLTSVDGSGLTLNSEQWSTLVQLLDSQKHASSSRLSGPSNGEFDWSG